MKNRGTVRRRKTLTSRVLCLRLLVLLALAACQRPPVEAEPTEPIASGRSVLDALPTPALTPTPLPLRRTFEPGLLVDYTAQDGDTLASLARRFNSSVEEIRSANPNIPEAATTMPPGMPMKMPIYFRALWGTPFKILPDSLFVNGPAGVGFNTSAFVDSYPGWLKDYADYPSQLGGTRSRAKLSGAEIVDYLATTYSLSPRLLLAILEYQGGALTLPEPPTSRNVLGIQRLYYSSPYLQLVLAANLLNNGYYGWRSGDLFEFELMEGSITRPDPWQNAASVALQYYFSKIYSGDPYEKAVGPTGLFETYARLFGDPWEDVDPLIPGSLTQPSLGLPFPANQIWSYTGGPHTGYGTGAPFAAIDFAPPAEKSGCFIPQETDFATAVADGLVVRSDVTGVILDLDGDGDERTGWAIYYLHLAAEGRAPLGTQLARGDRIGYPSCESGHATGTHVHLARKYNGEWILADGPLALDLQGWVAHSGDREYLGTLTRAGLTVVACECSDRASQIGANTVP